MKRVIMALSVVALLMCGSFWSLAALKKKSGEIIEYTEQIYSLYTNEEYEKAYKKAQELYQYWNKSSLLLNVLVDTDRISTINSSVYKIIPYMTIKCDELESELESIKAGARWLYECERPVWYNIF